MYTCDICHGTFSRQENMLRHVRNSHRSENDNPYVCMCGRSYTRSDILLRHQRGCETFLSGGKKLSNEKSQTKRGRKPKMATKVPTITPTNTSVSNTPSTTSNMYNNSHNLHSHSSSTSTDASNSICLPNNSSDDSNLMYNLNNSSLSLVDWQSFTPTPPIESEFWSYPYSFAQSNNSQYQNEYNNTDYYYDHQSHQDIQHQHQKHVHNSQYHERSSHSPPSHHQQLHHNYQKHQFIPSSSTSSHLNTSPHYDNSNRNIGWY